ncbi:allantoate amidohydrolase [Microlunatus flavus]|uniref:N-carbamoyl-L-amino-acid hydrolase n=1 Tax=Microlunatus flavus TaxID=1036181 RepID=A0A1H9N9N8_9ACTN|nr:allantoate amidohydrolase [Microlunatus flavus]SER32389.1 N-carbamoyl-L-amino-acid hydrolase [Microlunatus flavus]
MGSTFDGLWADLADLGREPRTGGYRRFAWTRTDHTLHEWFAGEAARRGLDLVEDRAGNRWAWWGDPDAAPGVVTGSHLDSVPDGGAYDGPLGVVSAFAALDALRARGHQPARPLGVVSFVDEEGARFGVACAGSRVITGALEADRALGLADADGTTLAEALRAAGRRPEDLGPDPEALRRVGTFVELHVEQGGEQGRRLVDRGRAVGVAGSIWPHGRWRADVPGTANHAGTTALDDRDDALLAATWVVQEARRAAERHGCLATVGRIVVEPGGVNAVPSHVTAWLDARGADERSVHAAVEQVAAAVARAGGTLAQESWTPPTTFDPALAQRLGTLLGDAPVLATGAGHDAGILANAGVSTAMLLVRNPTGVSHAPAEHADRDDCLAGVDALTAVLADLTGAPA